MPINDFCVFILTHGRPDNVITYNTLRKQGYTGKIYIIIDNEDKTSKKYYENFGDQVIMFDKGEIAKTFDEGDNFDDRRTITYARNACFDIAKQLKIHYFMQLDDDYNIFSYKFDHNYKFIDKKIHGLDRIFFSFLEFYKNIPALSIAMAQKGDFLGGAENGIEMSLGRRRKCMNSFICSVNRSFKFKGRFNEDVNTYTEEGKRGALFLTIPLIALNQAASQSNSGGITELYKKFGTYVKSFMTIIYSPSCTKVRMMRSNHPRLHHQITWKNAVPVIIQEKYKKVVNL